MQDDVLGVVIWYTFVAGLFSAIYGLFIWVTGPDNWKRNSNDIGFWTAEIGAVMMMLAMGATMYFY